MKNHITPSEYLKLAGQDFQNLPAGVCNTLLELAKNSDGGVNVISIPDYISKKYHARMQAAWTVMAFKILFANATNKYSLIQRHKMLRNALVMQKCLER